MHIEVEHVMAGGAEVFLVCPDCPDWIGHEVGNGCTISELLFFEYDHLNSDEHCLGERPRVD